MQNIKEGENFSKLQGKRVKDSYTKTRDNGGFTGRKKPFGYNIIHYNNLRMLQKNYRMTPRIIEKLQKVHYFILAKLIIVVLC